MEKYIKIFVSVKKTDSKMFATSFWINIFYYWQNSFEFHGEDFFFSVSFSQIFFRRNSSTFSAYKIRFNLIDFCRKTLIESSKGTDIPIGQKNWFKRIYDNIMSKWTVEKKSKNVISKYIICFFNLVMGLFNWKH